MKKKTRFFLEKVLLFKNTVFFDQKFSIQKYSKKCYLLQIIVILFKIDREIGIPRKKRSTFPGNFTNTNSYIFCRNISTYVLYSLYFLRVIILPTDYEKVNLKNRYFSPDQV